MSNILGAFATSVAIRIDDEISKLGFRSSNAATALVTVGNHPDDTIDVLCRVLNLTHSGAVRLINGLEEDGFVERRRSRDDARAVVIRLTTEGRSKAGIVLEARSRITSAVLEMLADEQKAALTPAMETVLRSLTNGNDEARRICRLCNESICRPEGCPVENAASSM
ncbi:MarR family winged helix-turn-helix transcriptional regulator [Kordiimonas aquimaris]|uniref:MarR family winged helix-turn-helix transcriptional regulator n=1 Tax=Kordiimonas aquimaris TaxID=707591 RepID=UPI0021D34E86|nr:MarR family winged helix-turn-helix transcriptional regulator [Kordiimonas aquimaris]